jgi:cytochrome c553
MNRNKTTMAAAILALLAGAPLAHAADAAPEAVVSKANNVCRTCHGPGGDSVSSTFPRLNGQQADYIASQLKGFKNQSRSDPHAVAYMWGMASQIDDSMAVGLAKYYSNQKPTQPQTGGALASAGKALFMNGDSSHAIPPCAACHGEHGEGMGSFPRLAGQHADYLKHQLEDFRSTLRESDVMHANTKEMTNSQIEAVVSYLAND